MRVSSQVAGMMLLVLAGAGAAACGGDSGKSTGPGGGTDLTGSPWNLTAAEYTDPSGTYQPVDLYALGFRMTLTFTSTQVTVVLTVPPLQPQTFTSNYSQSGGNLTYDANGDGQPDTGALQVNGNTMTITADDSWDFNNDGTPEPATLHLTLTR
jgi:hypothetical protein